MIYASNAFEKAREMKQNIKVNIQPELITKLDTLIESIVIRFADYTCLYVDHSNVDPELYDGEYLPCGENSLIFVIDNNTVLSEYFESYGYYVESGHYDNSLGFLISLYPITEENYRSTDTYTPYNKREK